MKKTKKMMATMLVLGLVFAVPMKAEATEFGLDTVYEDATSDLVFTTDTVTETVDTTPTQTPDTPVSSNDNQESSTGNIGNGNAPAPSIPDPTPTVPDKSENSTQTAGNTGSTGSTTNNYYTSTTTTYVIPNNSNDSTGSSNTTGAATGTTTKVETPDVSINSSSDDDGVSASVKKNWDYTLKENQGKIELLKYIGTAKTVSVPNTIKVNGKQLNVVLGPRAFYGNKSITKVTIGKNVGCQSTNGNLSKCFYGCSSLKTVTNLPWDVRNLTRTFYGCKKLTKITGIPDSVSRMSYCFAGCKSLKTVTIPDDLNPKYGYRMLKGTNGIKLSGISKKKADTVKGMYEGAKNVKFA